MERLISLVTIAFCLFLCIHLFSHILVLVLADVLGNYKFIFYDPIWNYNVGYLFSNCTKYAIDPRRCITVMLLSLSLIGMQFVCSLQPSPVAVAY